MRMMTYLHGIVMEENFHLLLFNIDREIMSVKILTKLYKFSRIIFQYDKL